VKRIVCFALLSRLPNEGLTEIIENLRDAIEFYRSPVAAAPPLLPAHGRTATKGKTVERAPLVLEEEG
jgi:hypothetical protein